MMISLDFRVAAVWDTELERPSASYSLMLFWFFKRNKNHKQPFGYLANAGSWQFIKVCFRFANCVRQMALLSLPTADSSMIKDQSAEWFSCFEIFLHEDF